MITSDIGHQYKNVDQPEIPEAVFPADFSYLFF